VVPALDGALGLLKDFAKSLLHAEFDKAHVSLDSTLKAKVIVPGNSFTVLCLHAVNDSPGALFGVHELDEAHSIEAISHVLVDFLGISSVGENCEQDFG